MTSRVWYGECREENTLCSGFFPCFTTPAGWFATPAPSPAPGALVFLRLGVCSLHSPFGDM